MRTIPQDYIPFGDEWEKEMMKLPKKVIIAMVKKNGLIIDQIKEALAPKCDVEFPY